MTLFLITTLGLLFAFSAALGVSFQKMRVPAILSFFVAGFLIKQLLKPLGFDTYSPSLDAFSKFGVVFLLFLVGLKINPTELNSLGSKVIKIALLQVIVTSMLFFIGLLLFFNLPVLQALFLAGALSFSSTIVATKMIYKRNEQDTLYAKISFGILIIQDILAVILIMAAGMLVNTGESFALLSVLQLLIKLVATFLIILLGLKLLPIVEKYVYRDQELLFMFAISVCLLFSGLFQVLNIGLELGALTAGVLLAQSSYQREISSRINPIKNLFLVIYFAWLGMKIDINFLVNYFHIIAALSLLIAWIIKPFVLNLLMSLFGYNKHDSFKTSLVLSQISEFTILIALALQFSTDTIATIVAVFITTVTISSVLFENSVGLAKRIRVKWWHNEESSTVKYQEPQPEILLIGAHRLGDGLINKLRLLSSNILVIDNNPEIINNLQVRKINCLYGDASEADFLETLDLSNLKMILSTVPDLDTNLFLLDFLKRKHIEIKIALATSKNEAEQLYDHGATYVIMPYELGKNAVSELINKRGLAKSRWVR